MKKMTRNSVAIGRGKEGGDIGDPVHCWFGDSNSAYIVLPRSVLQSMPVQWQERFVKMMQDLEELYEFPPEGKSYIVQLRGRSTSFETDPLWDYDKGRRHVAPNRERDEQ